MQGCQCHPGSGERVVQQCDAQTNVVKCSRYQSVTSVTVLKLIFGISQHLEKKNQYWNFDDDT